MTYSLESEEHSEHRQFSRGQFTALREWLHERVHQQGRRYPAAQLIRNVCDQQLSSEPLMEYLSAKLMPLYGLG